MNRWLQGPALHPFLGEIPFSLECLQMIGDSVGRSYPEMLTDLANGRRIAPIVDAVLNECQDLLLAVGKRWEIGHGLDVAEQMNPCQMFSGLHDRLQTYTRRWRSSALRYNLCAPHVPR